MYVPVCHLLTQLAIGQRMELFNAFAFNAYLIAANERETPRQIAGED